MSKYLTLDEIKVRMDQAPYSGEMMRDLFRVPGNYVNEEVKGPGYTLMVTTNYRETVQYSWKHPMELLGYVVALWVTPGSSNQKAMGTVADSGELDGLIERLYAEAARQCPHKNFKHTRNLGNCYNEYQCTDCGEKFTVDSSD